MAAHLERRPLIKKRCNFSDRGRVVVACQRQRVFSVIQSAL